jgi:hypothetical protein
MNNETMESRVAVSDGPEWIEYTRTSRFANGKILRITIPKSDIHAFAESKGDYIVNCYLDPKNLAALSGDQEPISEVFTTFLPTKKHIRNGDFGEITCAILLAERDHPLKFPLFRWRLKQAPNSPVQGVDLIGYGMPKGEPSGADFLVICEVKTRASRRRKTIARDVYRGVKRDYVSRLSEQLLYQDRLLREQGMKKEAESFRRFRYPHLYQFPFETRLIGGVVHDAALWMDDLFDLLPEKTTNEEGVTSEIALMCVETLASLFEDLQASAVLASKNYGASS